MSVNVTNLTIWHIPPYLFFAGSGFVIAFSFFVLVLAFAGKDFKKYSFIFIISILGLYLGACFLGLLLNLITLLHYHDKITVTAFTRTSIIFYGGLIGFLVSFLILAKKRFKMIDFEVLDVLGFICPLFHVFGRIGCFMAGCCYGVVSDSYIAVEYTNYIQGEISTARRVPISLIEAAINLVLFVSVFLLFKHKKFLNKLLNVYLIAYSSCRFFIEFYRGDWDRNIFTFLSISQIISLLIISLNIVWLASKGEKK